MKLIETIARNTNGDEEFRRDFETMKEARAWVKECGLDAQFWDQGAESEGYAERNIHTIELLKDGDCVDSWETGFNPEAPC